MTFETALRATEILLALAFLQQSAEHIAKANVRMLFLPRGALSGLLLCGILTPWALLGLSVHSLLILHRYQGPYNGGSDKMGLLILYCLSLAHWLPPGQMAEAALGYLAIQVVLSYFISGKVKIVNPDWRSGQALCDVFHFSAYPVSENLRRCADRPRLLWVGSWAVMVFEVIFPLAFLHQIALIGALVIAASFHIANACLFGLNRFVWAWIAAYPSLLWFQARLMPLG